MTPGLGGERLVPEPDAVAREYLLLALRLDQRIPGLVDAYFGPADLKAQVDMEQLRPPPQLVEDAASLRGRVAAEVAEGDRRRWLDAQVTALETHARALNGDALPYLDDLERCFDFRPERRPEGSFAESVARLDGLVPGRGQLRERLSALDASLTVGPECLPAIADWLVGRFRDRAASQFGLPDGETLRMSLVRNQPWSGYNWYDGGLRSRVELNLDLPIRAPDLIHVLVHETYPGRDLEHAWKEADLVLERGRLEASALLINTPECLISEGLADLGQRFAVGLTEEPALLAELADRAGLDSGQSDSERARWAERQAEIARLRRSLGAVAVNAALMRHVDELSHDEVLAYLVDAGLMSPERAAKRLSFIEHPLWRTYVFVYSEGEQLLSRWLDIVPAAEQVQRFGRLLHEQLTPFAVLEELRGSEA